MDKSDWVKIGIGGLAVSAAVEVDVVELLEFINWELFIPPIHIDSHEAFAGATGSTMIEVPSSSVTILTSAPAVEVSSSASATS